MQADLDGCLPRLSGRKPPPCRALLFSFLLRIVHRRLVTRCQLSLQPNQSGRKIRFQPANKSAGEISLDLFLSGSALRGEGSCALRLRRRHFPRQFLWADFELPIATGYWDSGTLQMLSLRVSKQKELPSRSSIAFPRPRNQTGNPDDRQANRLRTLAPSRFTISRHRLPTRAARSSCAFPSEPLPSVFVPQRRRDRAAVKGREADRVRPERGRHAKHLAVSVVCRSPPLRAARKGGNGVACGDAVERCAQDRESPGDGASVTKG